MGKYYTAIRGGYQCNKCGKILKEIGSHSYWHRKKMLMKQVKLSSQKPLEHTATCKCYDCERDREITGK
mgnify:CR=1 FL=1